MREPRVKSRRPSRSRFITFCGVRSTPWAGSVLCATTGQTLVQVWHWTQREKLLRSAESGAQEASGSEKLRGQESLCKDSAQATAVRACTHCAGIDRGQIGRERIVRFQRIGNKLLLGTVNANYRHFESGISDMAQGEIFYPGVTQKILTTPVNGLDNYREMMRQLVEEKDALKVFVNVAEG